MPHQYTIPQCPELIIEVPNSDSDKARCKATQELIQLINEGRLSVQIPEGFSTSQLIEITEKDLMAEDEGKIINAVKILSKFSTSKQKTQELYDQAIEARKQLDVLFSNRRVSHEEFQRIKEGFKVLKEFALANLRYKEVLPEAENARLLLDEALESPQE